MNEIFRLKARLLEFGIAIHSQGFPLNGNFLRLPQLDEDAPAEIVIDIIPREGNVAGPPIRNWYKTQSGRVAFQNDKCWLEYKEELFSIEVSADKAKIEAPVKWRNFKLPEIALEIPLLMILKQRGYQPLHASAGLLKTGILFAGKSACGKSTLVKRLAEVGGKILSDDRVFLKKTGDKITAASSETAICTRKTTRKETKIELRQIAPTSKVTSMVPEILIFPKFQSFSKPMLVPLIASEAVIRLLSLTLPFYSQGDLEIFAKLTKQCRIFELLLPAEVECPQKICEILIQL